MSEPKVTLDDGDFVSQNFTMIHPNLVRKMGGDLDGVYILSRVQFRCAAQNLDEDGYRWWRVTLDELADEVGLSTPQVKRTVKRLIDGDLLLWKIENEHPHDRTRSYRINGLSRQGTKSSLGKDGIVPSKVRNRPELGTESSLLLSISEDLEQPQEKNTPPAPPAPDPFDVWYAAYPKKSGKIAAKKAFARALKLVDLETLLDGLERYKLTSTVRNGYVKDPATWLNGGHWEDEPLPEPTPRQAIRSGGLVERNGEMLTPANAEAYDIWQQLQMNEARASVALDHDPDYGTHSLEGAPW